MGKMDFHARRPTPTDEDQVPHKQIKAASFGKHCDQDLGRTQEEGFFTVICESTKVGVSKAVQGSPEGALFLDASEHLASLATKAEQAEQELAATLCTALASAQEDIQAGRRVGPMLATACKGHFAFCQAVLGSCQERLALTNHVGLSGQYVTNQIQLVEVDPNQHPMDQLRGILQTGTRMKDDST